MDLPGRSSLSGLLQGAFRYRHHRKVLYVAQDLAELLGELAPRTLTEHSPLPAYQLFGMIAGVEIIVPPEAEPGAFKLIEHNACGYRNGEAPTHDACEVIIEGRVDITTGRKTAR